MSRIHAHGLTLLVDAQHARLLQGQEGQGGPSPWPQDDHQDHDDVGPKGSATHQLAAAVVVGHATKAGPAVEIAHA